MSKTIYKLNLVFSICILITVNSFSQTRATYRMATDSMTVSMDSNNVSCHGGNDGLAIVNVMGGNPPYTFLWNDPSAQTSFIATNLSAGTYTVIVTDDSAASVSGIVTVVQPVQITNIIYPVICSNMTFDIGGHSYSSAGLYIDTISANNGCDSIVTTNLFIIPSYNFTVDTSIVIGDSLHIGNNYYSLDGSYNDTLVTVGGCDSVFTYNLTFVAGIKYVNQNNFVATVYPNPMTGNAVIKVPSHFEQKEKIFVLYDMFGKQMLTQHFSTSETVISKGELASAIYYFKVTLSGNDVSANGKIVIQ